MCSASYMLFLIYTYKLHNQIMTMKVSSSAANITLQDQRNSEALSLPEKVMLNLDLGFYQNQKELGENLEADQKSAVSLKDIQSPRSGVAMVRKWPASTAINEDVKMKVPKRILEIIEEESHIGEDVAVHVITDESDYCKYQDKDVWIWILLDRPTTPASPMSGKADY
ncbi:hypothetical protein ACET3Z_005609 [Daucus carota]